MKILQWKNEDFSVDNEDSSPDKWCFLQCTPTYEMDTYRPWVPVEIYHFQCTIHHFQCKVHHFWYKIHHCWWKVHHFWWKIHHFHLDQVHPPRDRRGHTLAGAIVWRLFEDCLKIVWSLKRSRLTSTFFRLSCDWLGFCFRRILDWFSKREWPILTDYGLSFDGVWTDFLTRNGLFWRTAFQQPCEWHPGRAERTVILH